VPRPARSVPVIDVEPERLRLTTSDGVALSAAHDPPAVPSSVAVVLAHGFTGSWQRAATRSIARGLLPYAGVLSIDMRGHGGSGGRSTVGDAEIHDLDAAVQAARALGYDDVVTCGWSMGAGVAIRHAALIRGVDGVVAVSGTSRWFVRDTRPMRRVHFVIERPVGRFVARHLLGTRIATGGWDPQPQSPVELVARVAPTPLLIVHGDRDPYFRLEHPQALAAAAGEPTEVWIVPGFGHAENAATPLLVDRIGRRLAGLVAAGRTR